MSFEPSASRGESLDARMRERLAQSLEYVFEQAAEQLGTSAGAVADLIASIRATPQSPQLFGAYYDLVLALEEPDLAEARDFAAELLAKRPRGDFRVAPIQDRPAREAERCARLFLEYPEGLGPAEGEKLAGAMSRIDKALDLLGRGFPEMRDEIQALIGDVVLASDTGAVENFRFDGASSYMLWGALLLNCDIEETVLEMAQTLAHESGHNLLFGLCADGPLAENSDEERYASPLRADARPMDGIIHATYVVARMHQTVKRLLDSRILSEQEAELARSYLGRHEESFRCGDEVIRASALLTPVGEGAMGSARAYMEQARG
jgi:HEXXH motif-containing protein